MYFYVVVDEEGNIRQSMETAVREFFEGDVLDDGGIIRDFSGNRFDIQNKYFDLNGAIQDIPPKPSNGDQDYWHFRNREWTFDYAAIQEMIVYARNWKLGTSDWTQVVDSPLSEESKAEWRVYRQALRDLTAQLTGSEMSVEDVAWPTAPA